MSSQGTRKRKSIIEVAKDLEKWIARQETNTLKQNLELTSFVAMGTHPQRKAVMLDDVVETVREWLKNRPKHCNGYSCEILKQLLRELE